ncbi:uncharacterized protein LOC122509600 [Leptopilina heterotoma]|uniref:uncharacterized protein LOC122509600 n=1 Tax=Leptopilina heterotoma TaxID=63436 RepID=UPI001CA7CC9B|nr:uncharacterized protein LOC122509600 [Leptopilina heterotoma]
MGGIQFPHLNDLSKQIWNWCEKRNIWVFASYIPSKENCIADEQSRLKNLDTEWELNDFAFNKIVRTFFKPEIDLFATDNNAKCRAFCSWENSRYAIAMDAFTISWSNKLFYAFPPFSMILRTLKKIKTDQAQGINSSASTSQNAFPGCRALVRESYARRQLPENTIDVLLASLSDSTFKQYNCALRKWWVYCKNKNLDVFDQDSNSILSFLTEEFNNGSSYGSLNTIRSAISLISNKKVSDLVMERFFRGIFKLKPSRAKYNRTWNVSSVLDKIAKWFPLDELDLKTLTQKLIILLALGTGHRVQTFSLISLDAIVFSNNDVEIKIESLVKTSRPGACQPCLVLPFFTEKPELCAALTLRNYLERTESLRGEEKCLFISFQKPHKAVGTQTISRWIKEVLHSCGVDRNFKAHSTRHASTSKAFEKGLDIRVIQNTVGWSQNSSTFAKFYNRPIMESESFFNVVINN